MEKPNSTDIFNFQSFLVDYYLSKGFFILEHNSNQLSSILNDLKLRIHEIDQLKIYFVMAKTTAISSVANTINKSHIQSDLYLIYRNKFYHGK